MSSVIATIGADVTVRSCPAENETKSGINKTNAAAAVHLNRSIPFRCESILTATILTARGMGGGNFASLLSSPWQNCRATNHTHKTRKNSAPWPNNPPLGSKDQQDK